MSKKGKRQKSQLEALAYETQTLEFATATTEKFSFKTAGGAELTVLQKKWYYQVIAGILLLMKHLHTSQH